MIYCDTCKQKPAANLYFLHDGEQLRPCVECMHWLQLSHREWNTLDVPENLKQSICPLCAENNGIRAVQGVYVSATYQSPCQECGRF